MKYKGAVGDVSISEFGVRKSLSLISGRGGMKGVALSEL